MKKKFAIGVLAAMFAIGALAAPGASAAVEFGDNCLGDEIAPGDYTLTELTRSPGGLPPTAPSNGVITQLKLNVLPFAPFAVPTMVKVLRSAGGNNYTVVNQTLVQVGLGQPPATSTRLPVLAGDRLGLHGEPFTFEGSEVPGLSFYCDIEDGSVLGAAIGNPGPGASAAFEPATEARVPIVAVLEPDVDGDGFGDETQDKCPQSAATQLECPVIVIDTLNLTKKGSAIALITTSVATPVSVSGKVKLGKGATVNMKAGSKTVYPGKFVRFKLAFPKALREKLKGLKPSKKLTLKVTAQATNVAGQVSTDKSKAKLKGQSR